MRRARVRVCARNKKQPPRAYTATVIIEFPKADLCAPIVLYFTFVNSEKSTRFSPCPFLVIDAFFHLTDLVMPWRIREISLHALGRVRERTFLYTDCIYECSITAYDAQAQHSNSVL